MHILLPFVICFTNFWTMSWCRDSFQMIEEQRCQQCCWMIGPVMFGIGRRFKNRQEYWKLLVGFWSGIRGHSLALAWVLLTYKHFMFTHLRWCPGHGYDWDPVPPFLKTQREDAEEGVESIQGATCLSLRLPWFLSVGLGIRVRYFNLVQAQARYVPCYAMWDVICGTACDMCDRYTCR